MFDIGMMELVVIFVVALLVFGPKRLPELSRNLGKAIRELKIALRGVKDSFHDVESELEKDISEGLKMAKQGEEQKDPGTGSQDNDSPYEGGREEKKDKEERG
jgi:TatA/E family protein of Tat protein translocase